MTSIGARARQINSESGYFIALSSCCGVIFTTPLGVVAPWADGNPASTTGSLGLYSTVVSTVNRTGTLYKDMGKTVISSGSFFRKVQLVVPQGASAQGAAFAGLTSTFGVAGVATGSGVPDFYTGYIRLGFDGQGPPAPVAQFGR